MSPRSVLEHCTRLPLTRGSTGQYEVFELALPEQISRIERRGPVDLNVVQGRSTPIRSEVESFTSDEDFRAGRESGGAGSEFDGLRARRSDEKNELLLG